MSLTIKGELQNPPSFMIETINHCFGQKIHHFSDIYFCFDLLIGMVRKDIFQKNLHGFFFQVFLTSSQK